MLDLRSLDEELTQRVKGECKLAERIFGAELLHVCSGIIPILTKSEGMVTHAISGVQDDFAL